MDIQFPAVLSMTINEARIIHKALSRYSDRITVQMAKEIGEHIEHYDHLERECGDVVSQYMPGGLHS